MITLYTAVGRFALKRNVIMLTKHEPLTTAELIMCMQKGIRRLRDNKTLLDTLYDDEKTTCYNISVPAKFSEKRQSVMQAVIDLYLRKQIIFERIL